MIKLIVGLNFSIRVLGSCGLLHQLWLSLDTSDPLSAIGAAPPEDREGSELGLRIVCRDFGFRSPV